MKHIYEAVLEDMISKMTSEVGLLCESNELLNHLCNSDYFVTGTHEAKSLLHDDVFEAIEKVINYEEEVYGDRSTDIRKPVRLANMLAYIIGEEILSSLDIMNEMHGLELDQENHFLILEEMSDLDVIKVYHNNN